MTTISSAAAADEHFAAADVPGPATPQPPAVEQDPPPAPGPGTLIISDQDAAEQAGARDYADTGARRAGVTWHGPEWHTWPVEIVGRTVRPSWRWARANTTSQEGTHDDV